MFTMASTDLEYTVEFSAATGGGTNVLISKSFGGPIGEVDGSGDIGSVDYSSPSDAISGTQKLTANCGVFELPGTYGSGHVITLSNPVGVSLGAQTTYTVT